MGDSSRMARVLDATGRMATHCGETGKSRDYLNRALAMAVSVGDRTATASVTNNLGTLDMETGNLASAMSATPRLWRCIASWVTNPRSPGCSTTSASTPKTRGMPPPRKLYQEALAIHKELGNATWIAYIYQNLAEVELDQGDGKTAKFWFESSLKILRELEDTWGIAYAIEGLGKCSLLDSDLPAARARFEEALATVRKIGDKAAVADQLNHLAQVAIREGDSGNAVSLAEESLTLRRN